ncbi:MAG: alpha amylase C-terminal domain-containing protein [Desulfobacterales bacterium]
MIFQGQEFLEDDWFHDRDPIDWSKKDTYSGILCLYRDLIKLRRNLDGKTRGLLGENLNIHHLNKADNMLAFHRWHHGGPKDDLVIVVNMTNKNRSAYRMGLPRLGQWRIRFNSDWHRYDPSFSNFPSRDIHTDKIERDGMPYSGEIDIAPYSTLVLSQDN